MKIMEALRLTLSAILLAVLDEALLLRQQIELLSPWEFESGVEKHIDLEGQQLCSGKEMSQTHLFLIFLILKCCDSQRQSMLNDCPDHLPQCIVYKLHVCP